jgi:hypothetical protein
MNRESQQNILGNSTPRNPYSSGSTGNYMPNYSSANNSMNACMTAKALNNNHQPVGIFESKGPSSGNPFRSKN